ncbi:MAG: rhodanese-like domain-containing protein [Puniceicoccales bacterium]|jgi:rhodanese-related sulfurtransferase|nr:rhodanese-like domain-containing protein [Puniceicoccales bacterium]
MCLFRQWLILCAFALAGAGLTAAWVERPAADKIGMERARRFARVLWVDARPEAEYASGHVSGAVSLNEDNWSRAIAGVLARWNPGDAVVVYCGGAECGASKAVAVRLRGAEYGLEDVYVLRGGWEAWKAGGGEVREGGAR